MKQKIKQIYHDLSKGKLTQKEALEKVRDIKRKEQGQRIGTLLATPEWEASVIDASSTANQFDYAQHHIILCEIPQVKFKQLESLIPHSHCLALSSQEKNMADSYSEYALACFEKIQGILKSKPREKVLVQIVIFNTRKQIVYAGLSGLLKTMHLENPNLVGQIILIDTQTTINELVEQLQDNQTRSQDTIIKYGQHSRQVLRWRATQPILTGQASQEKSKVAFKDHGVYLITGGLGGLGVLFAKEISKQTSKANIILAGRSNLTSSKKSIIAALSAQGNTVDYRQLDIGNLNHVKQCIDTIIKEYKQLNGILHSAGMVLDNFILRKTRAEFSQVLIPKVTGTFNLDLASRDIDLDFLMLFSSAISWLGNLGQADYATANAFMDQFANYRNQLIADKQRRGKTVSMNWPLWQAGGMSIDQASQEMLQRSTGVQPMQTLTGMQAFYHSLELQYDQAMVMEGDLAIMRRALLVDQPVSASPSTLTQVESYQVAEIDTDGFIEKTQDFLCKQLSALLKLPFHKIDPNAPLERYGINSILAMNLTNQLEKTFGSLSKTLFFEYQTIRELADYFVESHSAQLAILFATTGTSNKQINANDAQSERLLQKQVKPTLSRRFRRQRSTAHQSTNTDPIAIIGLSGRYPEAANIQEYWLNLRDGKDCIIEVPKERWDWREYYSEDRTKSGHHFSKWGGFIAGVDEFDPRFFNISPREAESIDPQERLFLQHAWMAVEDAGYTRASLQIHQEQDIAGQVGVYVGVMYGEYNLSGSLASIANRVSYVLNIHGPSMTLDTMCSSSLTAIHVACQDLKQGQTNLAIAGGVNISIHPNKYLALSTGQFISSHGHCQSFGEGGDGYIPAEGVGAVVLKRLSEAIRDANHIYGIINGSAINHGGKTNGYSVPNPQAQASVIGRALAESNKDPRQISYIEAHGTGTKLGDPIEIAALSKAFHQDTQDTGSCIIGSTKSNIGHCESAAGIAGLTKVLLQMQHQQIVPSLHSTRLNPHIDFQKTPFIVNQTLRTWDQPEIDGQQLPRMAGVSSFGAGGANAHLIVQEYVASKEANQPVVGIEPNAKIIIPLSARTIEQLQQKAQELLDFIRTAQSEEQATSSSKPIDLLAMAYTLQVGREAMDKRLGFMVSSVDQLADKIQAYVDGRQDIEDAFEGQVKNNEGALSLFKVDAELQQTIEKWIAEKKYKRLLDLWVKGLELDWNKLYGEIKPGRISLPAYPFARERYWKDIAANGQPTATAAASSVLHPLLHCNISDLIQQSYSSTFSGEEVFLTDCQVGVNGKPGQKVLPAVAHLEMVRVAVEKAMPTSHESSFLELHNVVWGQPIVVTENKQVTITLFAKDNDQVNYEIYSQDKEGEIVHCQGQAVFSHQPALAKIDIGQLKGQMAQGKLATYSLYNAFTKMGIHYGPAYQGITSVYQGEKQLLAELGLPDTGKNNQSDYILHPSVMDSALQATIGLSKDLISLPHQPSLPFALKSLRILSACTKKMFAWVRYSLDNNPEDTNTKLDIDLCDEQGNVCVQMRGMTYQQESVNRIDHALDQTTSSVILPAPEQIPLAPKQISISTSQPQAFTQVELKKPTGISLAAPSALASEKMEQTSLNKLSIRLSGVIFKSSMPESNESGPSSVSLYDYGNGIFSIQIAAVESGNTLSQDLIEQLLQALDRLQQTTSVKVLMISGTEHYFLNGGRKQYNEAVEQKLYQAILSFPYPVIAAMQGDATGAGFLVAALCDFMICSQAGNYYYTNPKEGLYPTASEDLLFKERFGEVRTTDFLYLTKASTGKHLQAKGWNCPILPQEQVEAYAQTLALNLAQKPQDSLSLLKQHLARHLVDLSKELTIVEPLPSETQFDTAQSNINITSPVKHLQLTTHSDKVLVIRICVAKKKYGIKELVVNLTTIFAQINQACQYRAIVLVSEHSDFLPETKQAPAVNVILDFQRLVLESPLPVIAVLDSNAKGMAWFLSQFCDAAIYHAKGSYCAANIWQSPELAKQAAMIFSYRFGNYAGREVLLTGAEYSGIELQQRIGTLSVTTQDYVLPSALELAESWAELPLDTLLSWKKEMALRIQEKIKDLPAWLELKGESTKSLDSTPTQITLNSKAIAATVHPEGIVVVKMEDREAKNMFSETIVQGMEEVFEHIAQTPSCKVVVLTGYDNYFASGGTKETLLAIQEGKAKFTDIKIYQLAMTCKVPVIAAMQGHGIGAGWSLGMFADFTLLGEESKYVNPYMNYGFTPGAGATLIFPDRVGYDLARETLLTGREYGGSELKERGLLIPIVSREQVYSAAMVLAKQVARGSRSSLIALKHQLSQHLHKQLEETYKLELAMHEKTYVGQPGTLEQIQNNFFQGAGHPHAETNPSEKQIHSASAGQPHEPDILPVVTASLKKLLAQELSMQEQEIEEDTQFVDLGLDSVTGVTWIRKINEKHNIAIEATKIYNYPTLSQLSRHVKAEAEKQGTLSNKSTFPANIPALPPNRNGSQFAVKKLSSWRSKQSSRINSAASSTYRSQPIAVIGMAGQFPQAKNLEEFWQNIAQGKNCISEVPKCRWDINNYYQEGGAIPGKANSKWMGALEEYDLFDPLFFNISPKEAESMDPQQRVFLQTCWHSIENAGYNPKYLSGSKCGVFVGCGMGDYHKLLNEPQLSAQDFTGGAISILAARISYFLNLQGPCLSINTACSSSLVAIANACDSLNYGSSDLALAGGVNVMAGPSMHIMTSQSGMLSPDGKCFAFDQRANGFVPGEGVGVVMLKRLDDAQKDQDIILGVIQGWGVNQDGKTNGITAPNPESQTRLQQDVYDKYQVDPTNIQLIEAHGTGTKLGDPIEVEALKESFKKYTQEKDCCALGSVKSNIGHCLSAAGVAGVIKVILALKNKQLPPTINFDQLNEHIGLSDSPFYINRRLQKWEHKDADRRQAAVSSFGFSGTNAHIVIKEYLPVKEYKQPVSVITQNTKIMVPLSGRTAEQLKQKACDLLDFIHKGERTIDLAEMVYTLQVGRESMRERLGFMVSSIGLLAEKLKAYIDGVQDIEDSYQGQVKRNKEGMSIISQDADIKETIIDKCIAQKKLSKLLDLWVKGLDFDWNKLYGEVKPQRISIPTYPFAKERYWIDSSNTVQQKASEWQSQGITAAVLHPLLHNNTSDLRQQSYRSTFTGKEFFLSDHQVKGQKILPGVAYMEMARAAIVQAIGAGAEGILQLSNIIWFKPMVVGDEPKDIHIALYPEDNDEIAYEIMSFAQPHQEPIIHSQGRAVFVATSQAEVVDLPGLKARICKRKMSQARCYQIFETMGLVYGPGHRGLVEVNIGDHEVLAKLSLPGSVLETHALYTLHPSIMDSALQASIGLQDGIPSNPVFPFALQQVEVCDSCTHSMWAWVRYADGSLTSDKVQKLDIDLCDDGGKVCVRMKGFSTRILQAEIGSFHKRASLLTNQEEIKPGLQSLVPVWNPVFTEPDRRIILPESVKILLLGGDQTQLDWVQKSYPNTQLLHLPSISSSIDFIQAKLKDNSFDHLLWIAPDEEGNDQIIAEQEQGVLAIFRIIKALVNLEYTNKELQWTIITSKTHMVKKEERIKPTHAGIFGLIGSLAKEYPHWNIRLLDVDSLESVAADECLSLAFDKQGNGLVYRQGEWFYQGLARLETLPEAIPIYKKEGVYVVIGGAGGIGEVWSRFMIEHYQAKIVWIGRQELNADIGGKIDSLSQLGDAPLYISADATQYAALEQAYKKIVAAHPTIHGVVHSAIVLQDQSIAQMKESKFRASLSAKVDISVNMDRVFGELELDFMLFFSSIISFMKTPGQSNYAAGCTFKDSFAQRLQQQRSYPVKVMNWGYWGNVGIVTDEFYNRRMEQMGIGSIEAQEGMASLQTLVSSEMNQMALIKTLNTQAINDFNASESIIYYPKAATTVLPDVQRALAKQDSVKQLAALEGELLPTRMINLVTNILASSLNYLGLFSPGIYRIVDLSLDKQPAPFYERWLSSSIRYLQQQGLLSLDLTLNHKVRELVDLWSEWETEKSGWESNPNLLAQITLLETCLKALPGILSGKQPATDIMFPNSSMELVEGIYKGNTQADYFNEALCETLKACIEHQLQADSESKIRILEIGAGTGGTTAKLLPLLQEFTGAVIEYCYTDLSKAFLMHAEEHYQPRFPALTTAIFDVSKPLASQSLATDHYDLVIATNVLHATPNIRKTLRNAKAVLKNQGILLLNEISTWSLFSHLTFGLLEGFWLYEDNSLRIPGSAGLTPEKWQAILTAEGFTSIFFPVKQAHKFGQQIIAAGSDGLVRQPIVNRTQLQPSERHVNTRKATEVRSNQRANASLSAADVTEQMMNDYIKQIITANLSKALKIDPGVISNDESFADYGVDSITGVNLVSAINEALQIEMETTSLFEYSSVNQLSQYILSKWSEKLSEKLSQSENVLPKPSHLPNVKPVAVQASAASSDGFVRQSYEHLVNTDTKNRKATEIRSNQRAHASLSAADVTEQMMNDHIEQIITANLSKALKIDPGVLSNDESFADYGVDSITGVNLVSAINEALQIELETTSLFEYSSVNQLSQYILSDWSEKISEKLSQSENTSPKPSHLPDVKPVASQVSSRRRFIQQTLPPEERSGVNINHGSIAIIGMSGRFAESESLEEFWQNLKQGKDLVKEVTRWHTTECVTSDSMELDYCSKGSFIDSIDLFDPLFFEISPKEAVYMDPQQRLFLEESWKALEDAGYAGKGMDKKRCGIYVGCAGSDYVHLFDGESPAQSFWGNAGSVIPARIAYYLNLHGPAVAVDTACSSSLVSIHLACQSLWLQETEMALAGGVFIQETPKFYQNTNRAGMLSPQGRCHTFDSRADGFVPGEGVGVVVLKHLEDALKDGDTIRGVIVASGINQDGKTNGITAPSATSQERLECSVYDQFNINPETIQVVEAHGTGTRLGDPIEYGAISRSFGKYTNKKQFCAIGSVKTNIGHAATAAGIAGVLKLLLSMQHKQIPPSLHFHEGNSAIDFESSPFYVNTKVREWKTEDKQIRRAATSSFGFSGTNAHLVIDEAPLIEQTDVESAGYLVVLSARTSEQLHQQVQNMLAFVESTPELSMNNLSYTLFVGRMHLAHRFSCIARSQMELVRSLAQWLETGTANQTCNSKIEEGRIREQASLKEYGNQCIQECRNTANAVQYLENLAAIAELYMQGYSLDFHSLFLQDSNRIPLPSYPFARERYWIESTALNQGLDSRLEMIKNSESIEDIINKIDDDSIETDHAIRLLKYFA